MGHERREKILVAVHNEGKSQDDPNIDTILHGMTGRADMARERCMVSDSNVPKK